MQQFSSIYRKFMTIFCQKLIQYCRNRRFLCFQLRDARSLLMGKQS